MFVRATLGFLTCMTLGGCFSDTQGEGATDGNCEPGTVGCPCYGNGSCNPTLQCEPTVQVCFPDDCRDGTLDCPCGDAGCDPGLVCDPARSSCQPQQTTTTTSTSTSPPTSTSTSTSTTAGSSTSDGGTSDTPSTSTSDTSTGSLAQQLTVYVTSAGTTYAPGGQPDNVRSSVDELCASSATMAVPSCGQARAVFSVSVDDDISKLSQTLPDGPVFLSGKLSTPVAESFAEFVALDLEDSSLNERGLLDENNIPTTDPFWTGSDINGNAAANCDAWTQTSGNGVSGRGNTPGWLGGDLAPCDAELRLLCVCW